jgi:hypothetical protein
MIGACCFMQLSLPKVYQIYMTLQEMASLKTKFSYGYDKISTKLLKVSMPYIISPLTHICNESLAQGIFSG